MLATPPSWLLALDRWLCVPAFQRVCRYSFTGNMPKKVRRDKRGGSPVSTGAGRTSRRVHSVKDLIAQRAPALMRVTAQAGRANFWTTWLSGHLPSEVGARVTGVVEREGTLVIFAESAAWSARLRFAVQELEPEILAAAAGLKEVQVRVRPRD